MHKEFMDNHTEKSNTIPCLRDSQEVSHSWQTVLLEPLRRQTLDIAYAIAERLRDPDQVQAVAKIATHQSTMPLQWCPASLSFGDVGIAFVHAHFHRCFPHGGWDKIAYSYLRLAAQGTQSQPYILPGLFSGTCGIAAVLSLLGRDDDRYHKVQKRLNMHIYEQVLAQYVSYEKKQGVPTSEYDIINGASGIIAYLMTIDHPEKHELATINILLKYLIWLAGFDQELQHHRWYTPVHMLVTDAQRKNYPYGWLNCGLAHGIPGPLAALSSAWLKGYQLPGQREAITYLSQWIIEHQIPDHWGINWPEALPAQMASDSSLWRKLPPTRSAWCYGAPGIARALWLAGTALHDSFLQQLALDAIKTVLLRPPAQRRIDSPTLCHGMSGLLTICLRFFHETQNALLEEHISLLVSQILAYFNPSFPLGFRDQETPNVMVDQVAWLNGTPGIALALLAASTNVEPSWDHFLLIS